MEFSFIVGFWNRIVVCEISDDKGKKKMKWKWKWAVWMRKNLQSEKKIRAPIMDLAQRRECTKFYTNLKQRIKRKEQMAMATT